jgi:DnaK suppressor protein
MSAAPIDLAELRATLVERLQALRAARETTADARRPVELDQTSVGGLSRMDAMQGQAPAMATDQRRQDEARRIESTMNRMDDDEYGYCIDCGEDIGAARRGRPHHSVLHPLRLGRAPGVF